jgi:hypothetical protein
MKKRRILDLIEQADIHKHDHESVYIVDQEDLERFSHLIIQECAAQLEANRLAVYDANKHHEYWSCGVKWAVAKLKDHFAVKLKYLDCDTI